MKPADHWIQPTFQNNISLSFSPTVLPLYEEWQEQTL